MERQNGSKNQRILKLYASLMDGSVVSKAQEAVRYGVSEKSIQRDLDDIKEFMADRSPSGHFPGRSARSHTG